MMLDKITLEDLRRQLNSKKGLAEQWTYTKNMCRTIKSDENFKKLLVQNFKMLGYIEWKKSFIKVDSKDEAPWRMGLK